MTDRHPAEESDLSLTRRAALAGAAGLIGAGVVDAVSGGHAAAQTATPATPSLYDRLGGIFAIAAVVDRFSDAILVNPTLNQNPALKEWNDTEAATRLPGLKFMRTLWVAALAGGPFTYTGLPLHQAHQSFHLTPEEFDAVGAEIVRAMDYYKVPKAEQDELVAAYNQSKPEVVTAP
ncbi:MAG TPA: group 1 truncated hemoglobin [Thermomicrobiales bacterium]|nr:group 1 truncated hemoglobin [Thermomicrobiales bacterium]